MYANGRKFISEQIEAYARQEAADRMARQFAPYPPLRGSQGTPLTVGGLTLPHDDGDPHFVQMSL